MERKGEGDREGEGKVGEERCAVGIFNYFRLWVTQQQMQSVTKSQACTNKHKTNKYSKPFRRTVYYVLSYNASHHSHRRGKWGRGWWQNR